MLITLTLKIWISNFALPFVTAFHLGNLSSIFSNFPPTTDACISRGWRMTFNIPWPHFYVSNVIVIVLNALIILLSFPCPCTPCVIYTVCSAINYSDFFFSPFFASLIFLIFLSQFSFLIICSSPTVHPWFSLNPFARLQEVFRLLLHVVYFG